MSPATPGTSLRCLVTGGAGFIGSHLVDRLLCDGHEVVVLDNFSTGKRENLPLSHPRLRVIRGDICVTEDLEEACTGVAKVFHLAALVSVPESFKRPAYTMRVCGDATRELIDVASRAGATRLVYASSAAVYGDPEVFPVSETTPLQPLSPYADGKLEGEAHCVTASIRGTLDTVRLRFFNIYGPRQDPSNPYAGVISIFADRVAEEREVTLFGTGEQTRDFVYVRDLVEVLVRAANRPGISGRVFNVGTERETSLLELLSHIEELSGKTVARRFVEAREGDIFRSVAANRHLLHRLGELEFTDIKHGLKLLLRSRGDALAANYSESGHIAA